jgi:AraC-like DNA-binding protein
MLIQDIIYNLDFIVFFIGSILLISKGNKSNKHKVLLISFVTIIVSIIIEKVTNSETTHYLFLVKPSVVYIIALTAPLIYISGKSNLKSYKSDIKFWVKILSIPFLLNMMMILYYHHGILRNEMTHLIDISKANNFYNSMGKTIEDIYLFVLFAGFSIKTLTNKDYDKTLRYPIFIYLFLNLSIIVFLILAFTISIYKYIDVFYNIRILIGLASFWIVFQAIKSLKIVIISSKPELNQSIKKNIETFIKDKGYVETSLTISKLSYKLGVNEKLLSEQIKLLYSTDFNNWLNKLRIDESKLLLENNSKLTIEGISKKSGFNSKPTFHRYFKKFTEMTPTEYIKSLESVSNTENTDVETSSSNLK